ncbi:MAG: hypothetical protein ABIH38_04610 [Patescibacteria group bacterium]|nr:hypothetical protein [Patescibacteria group bacterium]
MIQKISPIFLYLLFALFISGCSLSSSGSAGVFKSTNAGQTFEAVNTIEEKKNISSVNVLAITIDPKDFQRIYLGTEESGIFVSENSGQNWRQLTPAEKVYDIVIDPRDTSTIYALSVFHSRGKIIKSMDRGQTWVDLFVEPQGGGYLTSLAVDSFNPDILYAGNTRGILYKTVNQGQEWSNIAQIQEPILAIEMDAGDTRNIYLMLFNKGVYKIDHSGAVSEDDDDQERQNQNQLDQGLKIISLNEQFPDQSQPQSIQALLADPKKKDTVYAATSVGLFISQNSGQDWREIPILIGSSQDQNENSSGIHSLAVAGRDSRIIFFGARGTFYRSFDHGQSWQAAEFQTSNTVSVIALEPGNEDIIYLGIRKLK